MKTTQNELVAEIQAATTNISALEVITMMVRRGADKEQIVMHLEYVRESLITTKGYLTRLSLENESC